MKDKIISFILILIVIAIFGVIGVVGFIVYNQIIEGGKVEFNLFGDGGYPTIEDILSSNNTTTVPVNDDLFDGVNGSNEAETDKTTEYITKSRYLYNQLSDTAKLIYDKLYENKENLKTGNYAIQFGDAFQSVLSKENGEDIIKSEYQSAIEALVYENPEIFYIDVTKMYINIEKITKITGTKYNVYINNGSKPNYLAEGLNSKQDIENYETKIHQVRDYIISDLEGKSNYEKIKEVHDYLVETIEYDKTLTGDNMYNIYGALVERKCVCEGYAKAFQYLMNELGIENTIVIGTATNNNNETESHAWNYVKLDGKWYAVDSTWDDPITTGGGILTNRSKYRYFLKGSNTMNENHVTSGKFTDGGQEFEYPELSIEDYE